MMMDASVIRRDGGWGWVVVFGAFISHFLTCGYEKGYSVLYIEIINKYGTTAAFAAGLSGFSAALRLLLAPVSVMLCQFFSEQSVVIFGGLMCFAGLFVASASDTIYGVSFGYGMVFGLGLTLVYTPSLTVCTTYFDKRRSTAVSLSLSGCGFAALVMPYMIVHLLDKYAYDGAVMLLASVSLHYCISGALYRSFPVEAQKSESALQSPHLKTSSSWSILKIAFQDTWLVMFLFSFCFNMMGSGPVTTLLIHHAENLGYRRMASVQLLAIEGVAQILVRITIGPVFDHPKVKPHRGVMWSITIAISALIILLLAFTNTLAVLSFLMVLRGVTLAIYISQQAVIAADMCEHIPHSLKQTIGLTQIGKGVGILVGSWCAGAIRDFSDRYRPAFLFLSAMQFIGSLAAFVAVINCRRSNGLPRSNSICGSTCPILPSDANPRAMGASNESPSNKLVDSAVSSELEVVISRNERPINLQAKNFTGCAGAIKYT